MGMRASSSVARWGHWGQSKGQRTSSHLGQQTGPNKSQYRATQAHPTHTQTQANAQDDLCTSLQMPHPRKAPPNCSAFGTQTQCNSSTAPSYDVPTTHTNTQMLGTAKTRAKAPKKKKAVGEKSSGAAEQPQKCFVLLKGTGCTSTYTHTHTHTLLLRRKQKCTEKNSYCTREQMLQSTGHAASSQQYTNRTG